MSDFICNILIMGATGTGKSSLLNYLCGKDLAEAGAGKPVTKEGIFEFSASLNGQAVRIYDSWGIEAGKVERWKSIIANELKDHGADRPIEEWFHSVVYCIQAGGARIQDTDAEIIRQFYNEGYNVLIVLTKADQVSEDDEAKMKSVILDEVRSSIKEGKKCNIVSCCSVEKKTRSGCSETFGREEIIDAIINNWRATVIDRLPRHVICKLQNEIDAWGERVKDKILHKYEVYGTVSANKDVYERLKDEYDSFVSYLDRILPMFISEAIAMCNRSNSALSKTFNGGSVPTMFSGEGLKSVADDDDSHAMTMCITALSIETVIGSFIMGTFFPAVGVISGIAVLYARIKEYRAKHNKENIANQKQAMMNIIDETAKALKEHVERGEKQIKSCIEKYI